MLRRRAGPSFEQAGVARGLHRRGAGGRAELAEDRRDVVGDRALGEVQRRGDLAVRGAARERRARTSCSRRVSPAGVGQRRARAARAARSRRAPSRSRANARAAACAESAAAPPSASRAARSSPGSAASAASYGASSARQARIAPRQSPASSSATGSGSGGRRRGRRPPLRAAHSSASLAGRTSCAAYGAARPARAWLARGGEVAGQPRHLGERGAQKQVPPARRERGDARRAHAPAARSRHASPRRARTSASTASATTRPPCQSPRPSATLSSASA